MKKPENKLNRNGLKLREQLFADWYIKLMHETDAAIKAGYSPRSAHVIACRLLKKDKIQAYIAHRKTQLEEVLGLNKATVIQDFQTIKKRSMQAEPVMEWDRDAKKYVQVTEINDEGEEVGVWTYDSQGANRALENINKMMGYNAPEKVDVLVPIQVNVNFNWPKKSAEQVNE